MAEPKDPAPTRDTLSRRTFLKSAGGVAAGGMLTSQLAAEPEATPLKATAGRTLAGDVTIELDLNGRKHEVTVEPRTTLLSALRHHIEPPHTGTKEVCDQGNCGACTVIVDGRPAYSCMLLAVDLVGRKVRTVEGLGSPENMSPVQAAFCEHDALMCGFCTPGFVVAMTACLERKPGADMDTIKRELSGNLCRCGTYPHIFDAAVTAQAALAARKGGK